MYIDSSIFKRLLLRWCYENDNLVGKSSSILKPHLSFFFFLFFLLPWCFLEFKQPFQGCGIPSHMQIEHLGGYSGKTAYHLMEPINPGSRNINGPFFFFFFLLGNGGALVDFTSSEVNWNVFSGQSRTSWNTKPKSRLIYDRPLARSWKRPCAHIPSVHVISYNIVQALLNPIPRTSGISLALVFSIDPTRRSRLIS